MKSRTNARFWRCYDQLPAHIQRLADANYALFAENPFHPALHFKQPIDNVWSVRIGAHYRALARRQGDVVFWFWIGTHAEYDAIVRQR